MNQEIPTAPIPEETLLAKMMLDSSYTKRGKSDGLLPSMFHDPANRLIYATMIKRDDDDQDNDVRSLFHELEKSGKLEQAGGLSKMESLVAVSEAPVTSSQFEEHLSEVRDAYAKRKALHLAERAKNAVFSSDTAADVIESFKYAVEELNLATVQKQSFTTIKRGIKLAMDELKSRIEKGDIPGQPTSIALLDHIGGGMRPGELWIIGGKTSAGKSALSLQMINPTLDDGGKVLVFTLEMGVSEVVTRLISCRNRVSMRALTNPKNGGDNGGGITNQQKQDIKRAAGLLSDCDLLISDEAGMSIDYVISQSEQQAEIRPVDIILVDYLQLLTPSKRQGESREQELSRISKQLKQLAKKLNCVVMSPSQLNDEGRLRESRAIGQDADVLLTIVDDGVRIDKYRSAARGTVMKVELVGEFQRFEQMR